jgi:iron complex transport system substrate-binding protein
MRIVSLLPSATEILFDIGAGDDVVGVTHECDFPQEAMTRPQLTQSSLPHANSSAEIDTHVRRSLHQGSSLYHLDAELLETLEPDLIVTQELCEVCAVSYGIVRRAAKQLKSDPRIISLEPSSLADVLENITYLGELTHHEAGAKALVNSLQSRIHNMKSRTEQLTARPKVLVLEWTDPPMSAGHWTPGLVELAGGTSILDNPGANSRRLEWSEITAADPDHIVVGPCGFDLKKTRAAIAELAGVDAWRKLRAVREFRVHEIDGNAYMNRPGPRLVDTAEIMAEILESKST